MRVMAIGKATKETEAGVLPTTAEMAEMEQFNEELINAGILLAGEGLRASSEGVRIYYDGSKRTVVDGPFTEAKEMIAGYTLIQVKSREEALEWTRRFPNPRGNDLDCEIEVRRLFELEDFEPKEAVQRFRDIGMGGKEG